MKAIQEPPRDVLLRTFRIEDDMLFWIAKPPRSHRDIGFPAGYVKGGYRVVKYKRRLYSTHRLMWIMRGGDIPEDMLLDHIDGNPLNNAPENLRLVTYAQNNHNRCRAINNTSGVPNVYWYKSNQKWGVSVMCLGVKHFAGFFSDIETAANVAVQLKRSLHGDYARREK